MLYTRRLLTRELRGVFIMTYWEFRLKTNFREVSSNPLRARTQRNDKDFALVAQRERNVRFSMTKLSNNWAFPIFSQTYHESWFGRARAANWRAIIYSQNLDVWKELYRCVIVLA